MHYPGPRPQCGTNAESAIMLSHSAARASCCALAAFRFLLGNLSRPVPFFWSVKLRRYRRFVPSVKLPLITSE